MYEDQSIEFGENVSSERFRDGQYLLGRIVGLQGGEVDRYWVFQGQGVVAQSELGDRLGLIADYEHLVPGTEQVVLQTQVVDVRANLGQLSELA